MFVKEFNKYTSQMLKGLSHKGSLF